MAESRWEIPTAATWTNGEINRKDARCARTSQSYFFYTELGPMRISNFGVIGVPCVPCALAVLISAR